MGASAARALAVAGREVTIFERRGLGHTLGSSHGTARIFRASYPDPMYVQMAAEARRLWDELSDECGQQLLEPCPAINTGAGVDAVANAVGAGGGRWVDGEPDAATIRADIALRASVEGAIRRGATLREHSVVESLKQDASGIELVVDGAAMRARTSVITAGPWAADLLATAGIDLPVRPTRETVSHYELPVGPVPILIDWTQPLRYCLPTPDGFLKGGEHIAGPHADPEGERSIDRDSVERSTAWLASRFDGITVPVMSENCFYTNTVDEDFILEARGSIVVGSACSGHGFKFAPLIGARLAAMVADGLSG
jgi:sarcosine oxidase